MENHDLPMEDGENQDLTGFCKRCHKPVVLKESIKDCKNGTKHVRGCCSVCGRYVKFIAHDESRLFKESNNGAKLSRVPSSDSDLIMSVKKEIPDFIPEIQSFITHAEDELRRLQSDPDRDTAPYSPSQMNSVAILFAEAKIGHLLKELGADQDDRSLPFGISRKDCDFVIKLSQYEEFIAGALDSVVFNFRAIEKLEFYKLGEAGEKFLKYLIDEGAARERSETVIEIRVKSLVSLEMLASLAAEDENASPHRGNFCWPTEEIVTWKHVFKAAFLAGKF